MSGPEQLQALQLVELARKVDEYEEIMARVVERRAPRKAQIWESAPLLSSIVAILSLIFGYCTQRTAKEGEYEVTERLSVRKAREEVLMSLHSVMAQALKATEDRLDIATGRLNDLSPAERDTILVRTNGVDDDWREKRESNDFLIPYRFAEFPRVDSTWAAARDSMQLYITCAESIYEKYYEKRNAPGDSCADRQRAAREAVTKLWSTVNQIDTPGRK